MNSECMLITYVCMFSQGSVNFKFGVLYAKDGQLTDDEMFSNGEHRTTPNMLIILNIVCSLSTDNICAMHTVK